MKIIVAKKKKKIVIVKNNIAIRIAGKVSRYIDALMNRATPTTHLISVTAIGSGRNAQAQIEKH